MRHLLSTRAGMASPRLERGEARLSSRSVVLLLLFAPFFRAAAQAGDENPAAPLARQLGLPRVLDDELRLELYSSEPEIATPVALDVDPEGRVWVIESNTHFPRKDYGRHPTDRVLILQGRREDGRAERLTTFTDGLTHAMGLSCRTPGRIFLATRRDIMLLEDTDENDRADRKTYLARLESKGEYPHNGLTGFAFDDLGFVYFAIGENLAVPYRLVGADGTTLSGGPDGGSIFRMRPDGSDLVRWAIGFWNTFHLAFDGFGRLFAVDNDPDSRPPCRLLHIVRGGDYGYRRWLGRRGLHPFTSWNGQLRGTLPMVAGTGEAPSGILAYEDHGLSGDLYGSLLVTSWGDHRIESYRLQRHGASYRSTLRPVVDGGDMFRPVGIAAAPDGSIYFSDWVDKDYHVHSKGRIWRLSRADTGAGPEAAPIEDMPLAVYDRRLSSAVRRSRDRATRELVEQPDGADLARKLLETSSSPHSRYHSLVVLARRSELDRRSLERALHDPVPELRAAAVRIVRDTRPEEMGSILLALVGDPHAAVRMESMRALAGPFPMDRLEEPTLPGVRLEPDEVQELVRHLRRELLLSDRSDPFLFSAALDALSDFAGPEALLAMALELPAAHRLPYLLALRRKGVNAARAVLPDFLGDSDPELRRAAMQWIGEEKLLGYDEEVDAALLRGPVTRDLFDAYIATKSLLTNVSPEVQDSMDRDVFLSKIVMSAEKPDDLRAMALRCMTPTHPALTLDVFTQLIRSAGSAASALGLEAVRSLRESALAESEDVLRSVAVDDGTSLVLRREAVVGLAAFLPRTQDVLTVLSERGPDELRSEAARALRFQDASAASGHNGDAASTLAELEAAALDGGRPAEGAILFNYPTATKCASCHSVQGRGGSIGPDLSTAGRMPPRKLLESILSPSREISPQFSTWIVVTDSGVKTGVIAAEEADGTIHLAQADGSTLGLRAGTVISRETSPASIMPENLLAPLSVEEVRDLLAYLASLK